MIVSILKLAAGPVIGAVIRYFTNLIAVKMLFYPHKAVKVFGKTLPFTPGVIPKGKPRLAKAIAKAVSESLITKEDLEKKILSADVIQSIAAEISQKLKCPVKQSIMDLAKLPEDLYSSGKQKLSNVVTGEIVKTLAEIDFSGLLQEKGTPLIMDSIDNPMVKMFVNESLINSFMAPLGTKLSAMILEEGNSFVEPLVSKKLDEIDSKSAVELLSGMNVSEQVINATISSIIKAVISQGTSRIFEKIDIREMVESKINEMDINQLEKIILDVMKKELNAIVNLGALIGLILGFVNMGISVIGG